MAELQRWLYSGSLAELKALAGGFDPAIVMLTIGFAALFGLIHAFLPGHGKTVIVSYYLGQPGRVIGGIGTSAVLVLTHVGLAMALVLGGSTVLQRTLGSAGRSPALETLNAGLVIVIGVWLLVQALRHRDATDGRVLAFATGLVPCPLTTFIMVYASANGLVLAGLILVAGMAAGMVAKIALFALTAMLFRSCLLRFMERTAGVRERVMRVLEIGSALAVISFGMWMLATR
jgi:ABC-type nickel/cobalt efflux system permease component RcnA